MLPTPWSITIGPGKLSTRATFVAKVKPLSARVPRVTPAPSPKPPRRGGEGWSQPRYQSVYQSNSSPAGCPPVLSGTMFEATMPPSP